MRRTKYVVVFVSLCVGLWAVAQAAQAQAKDGQSSVPATVAGHYEGIIKTRSRGDVPVTLDLRHDDDGFSGTLHTPLGDINVTGGDYTDGRLTIRMEVNGDEATFAGKLADTVLTGEFSGFGETGIVEVKRTGTAAPAPDTRVRLSMSKLEWHEDLLYLAAEIPRRHKNAFHSITREQFERAASELDAQLPTLDDAQIALGLSRLAAMIGDGHTRVLWHWSYNPVPLRLFWFGNELRVTGTTAEYQRALGARVVRIGKATLAEANLKAQPFIHQGENEWFVKSESASFLAYPALLHAIGLAPDAEHAAYTFEDAKGKRFTLDLPTMAAVARPVWMSAVSRMPLYLLQPSEPLWQTYLPDSQTVYFNFKSYPSRSVFQKFADGLFTFIDHYPVRRLVVDLRQNGGGDFTRGRDFIISEIKKRPAINRRGHLYVITGRWTFSAGMTNATDFRNETAALLVGEPTGGRPNNYQENREFMLPHSHLKVWVSTRFYKFQAKESPGVMPDQRIDPDWASYRAGRDPVMEWILRQASTK
jgi:hypothetical protein